MALMYVLDMVHLFDFAYVKVKYQFEVYADDKSQWSVLRGYIVHFNDIMTVSPYPWSLSLPLVVRVGVQYGGGLSDWLHTEECLNTDENQKQICTCLHEYDYTYIKCISSHSAGMRKETFSLYNCL